MCQYIKISQKNEPHFDYIAKALIVKLTPLTIDKNEWSSKVAINSLFTSHIIYALTKAIMQKYDQSY